MAILRALWRDQSGIAATEYAMLTAVVALVVLVAVGQLSGVVSGTMDRVADCFRSASPLISCQ